MRKRCQFKSFCYVFLLLMPFLVYSADAIEIKGINRIDTSLIPLKDALVMGNPNAEHKVIVFDNPDWPYCAKLHQEMKQIVEKRKDIVFYLKIFPYVSIYPQAYDKSRTIICEESKEKAMKLLEDAYAKKTLSKQTCDTKVIDENIELAKKLGINSTPTFVFDDGRVTSGYMKATQLIRLIEKEQPYTSDNIEIPDDLGEL